MKASSERWMNNRSYIVTWLQLFHCAIFFHLLRGWWSFHLLLGNLLSRGSFRRVHHKSSFQYKCSNCNGIAFSDPWKILAHFSFELRDGSEGGFRINFEEGLRNNSSSVRMQGAFSVDSWEVYCLSAAPFRSFASCTLLFISHEKLDFIHSSKQWTFRCLHSCTTPLTSLSMRRLLDVCLSIMKRVNYSCLCRCCLLCNLQFCSLTYHLLWVHSSGAVFASDVERFTRTSYVQLIERKVVGLVSTFTTSIVPTFPNSIPFFCLKASPSGGWIWWRRQLVCSHVTHKRPCWRSSAFGLDEKIFDDEKTIHKFVCLMFPEAFWELRDNVCHWKTRLDVDVRAWFG